MKRLFFVFVLATLILSACTATGTPATQALPRATVTPLPDRPTPEAGELELSDPTKPIEVNVGDDFAITVRTQPNPNYHWEIAEALDSNVVEYVWKDHISDRPNEQNSRGKDIWRFRAVAPGKATIILAYYKGQTVETLEKFAFGVVVK